MNGRVARGFAAISAVPPLSLVLTATVNPSAGVPLVMHADPVARRAEYLANVDRIARTVPPRLARIVLLENSGEPLEPFRAAAAAHGHRLLGLTLPDLQHVSRRGKGNGEAMLLERGLSYLQDEGATRYVAKLTGRIGLLNLRRLLPDPTGSYIACRVKQDLTQIDSRYFAGDLASMQSLLADQHDRVDEAGGRWLEHALLLRLVELVARRETAWRRLETYPRYVGVSGSAGSRYGGIRERVQWPLKAGVHRFDAVDFR